MKSESIVSRSTMLLTQLHKLLIRISQNNNILRFKTKFELLKPRSWVKARNRTWLEYKPCVVTFLSTLSPKYYLYHDRVNFIRTSGARVYKLRCSCLSRTKIYADSADFNRCYHSTVVAVIVCSTRLMIIIYACRLFYFLSWHMVFFWFRPFTV